MRLIVKVFPVALLLGFCLVLPSYGQTAVSPVVQSSFELGGFAGMIILPDASLSSLTTFGIRGGAFVTPRIEVGMAFSRAGISFLGVQLASINLFDGFASVDLMPTRQFGVLLRLGGSYILAEALGEGAGGFALLAGFGLRISPLDMIDFVAQYNARLRNGLLSTIEAGIRIRF
jgi:hypothetical protein